MVIEGRSSFDPRKKVSVKKGTHTLTCPDRPSEPRLPFFTMENKMEIFTSKNFSLFCTVFNACAAVTCFSNGSPGFGVLCLGFAGLCARNYWNAK